MFAVALQFLSELTAKEATECEATLLTIPLVVVHDEGKQECTLHKRTIRPLFALVPSNFHKLDYLHIAPANWHHFLDKRQAAKVPDVSFLMPARPSSVRFRLHCQKSRAVWCRTAPGHFCKVGQHSTTRHGMHSHWQNKRCRVVPCRVVPCCVVPCWHAFLASVNAVSEGTRKFNW